MVAVWGGEGKREPGAWEEMARNSGEGLEASEELAFRALSGGF